MNLKYRGNKYQWIDLPLLLFGAINSWPCKIKSCSSPSDSWTLRCFGLFEDTLIFMLCSSSSSLMASENLGGTVIPQSQLSHGLDNRTSSAGSWFLNNILPFLFFHQLTVLRLSIVVLISSRMGHSSMKSVLIHRCSLIIYTIKWISQCRCLREIYHAYFIRNDSQSRRADTVVLDFTIGEFLPNVHMEQWMDCFLLSL